MEPRGRWRRAPDGRQWKRGQRSFRGFVTRFQGHAQTLQGFRQRGCGLVEDGDVCAVSPAHLRDAEACEGVDVDMIERALASRKAAPFSVILLQYDDGVAVGTDSTPQEKR